MYEDSESKHSLLGEEGQGRATFKPRKYVIPPRSKSIVFLCSILTFSVMVNIFQATSYSFHQTKRDEYRSHFVGLKQNELQVKWDQQSVYSSANTTERDHVWDRVNHDIGVVAVPKKWAQEKGLPLGSTWPWNPDKAIYLVNAYHQLHCLKLTYQAFMDQREGRPARVPEHHVIHCLDQIYDDLRCSADDTLRVTAPNSDKSTAVGQSRSCRNWDALEEWAHANPACYRYGNPDVENNKNTQIPRMRFCPEGTPELEIIRKYFGKGKDWRPDEEPRWSWFDEEEK